MIKETVNEYRFRDVLMRDENASWTYGATVEQYTPLLEELESLGYSVTVKQ